MENEHTCCTQDDTTREGTSTLTRFLRMLDPVNAPLDPRNSMDLLVFAKHYADLLRFYDMDDSVNCVEAGADDPKTQNANTSQEQSKKELVPVRQDQKKLPENKKPLITWKEFFYSDIAVVVASISQYERKLLLIKKEYDALREEVELDTTKENFRELFYCIVHHLKRIQRWQERSIDGHPLKNELEIKIKSFLAPALKKLIAYDKVLSCAKSGFHDKQKAVIIIRGGPGTGKSVIAINLMADLLLKGYNAHYATGSKAFTETLRKIIGQRGSAQFKYFNSYSGADRNVIDILIADEAHRIRTTSNSRW